MTPKCRDCKWWCGEVTRIGRECMQPENQAKWDHEKTLWMGEYRHPNARYKKAAALACKKFEPKEVKRKMECRIKAFFEKDNPKCAYAGENLTEHCVNECGYYEKYQDLSMEARMVEAEIRAESGESY